MSFKYVTHIAFASNRQQAGGFLKDLLDSEADGRRNPGSGSRVAAAIPAAADIRETSRIASMRGKQPPGVAVLLEQRFFALFMFTDKNRILYKSTGAVSVVAPASHTIHFNL